MPIRVLIVDDHSIVRQGLRIFLEMDAELAIVGEAADGATAVQMARELQPDVVLMDLLMPIMDGVTATSAIRSSLPDTQVIALTSALASNMVVRAVQAGAIGYLLKDTDAPKLREAIKAAAAGHVQFSPDAAAALVHEIRLPFSPEHLTDREVEVLRHLAAGRSNKEIARLLHIGETTVKTHVKNIMGKLDVPSRTQAALYAVRIGLVTLDAPEPTR